MEVKIKSGIDIIEDLRKTMDSLITNPKLMMKVGVVEQLKQYVEVNEDVKKAIALYKHLLNHKEVQEAPINPKEPMCKICNKTAAQILKEDGGVI